MKTQRLKTLDEAKPTPDIKVRIGWNCLHNSHSKCLNCFQFLSMHLHQNTNRSPVHNYLNSQQLWLRRRQAQAGHLRWNCISSFDSRWSANYSLNLSRWHVLNSCFGLLSSLSGPG